MAGRDKQLGQRDTGRTVTLNRRVPCAPPRITFLLNPAFKTVLFFMFVQVMLNRSHTHAAQAMGLPASEWKDMGSEFASGRRPKIHKVGYFSVVELNAQSLVIRLVSSIQLLEAALGTLL